MLKLTGNDSGNNNEEALMMTVCKGKKNLVLAVTVLLPLLLVEGCTCVKYSYDTGTDFSGLKTYMWAPSSVGYGDRDPLLERNVQVLSDQLLGQKGFSKVQEKPDLLISIDYASETGYYAAHDYKVGSLALNVYSPEQREVIWRGTASPRIGSINTDASFGDVKEAVKNILSHFPPK
jgi:hypothetical protein